MKLVELIVETTEHDSIMLKMAKTIHKIIQKYDEDFTVYRQGKYLGKLETLTNIQKDTPLEILNSVHVELVNDNTINRIGNGNSIRALWNPDNKTIYLNTEYITDPRMRRLISHEIRHALDDFLSDFDVGQRYSTPKDKQFRYYGKDPKKKFAHYQARPDEINARFTEVLDLLDDVIDNAIKNKTPNIFEYLMNKFKKYLESKDITKYFPQGIQSNDYRRLYKRGIAYIMHKINEIESKN